jgi:hypothetical protein
MHRAGPSMTIEARGAMDLDYELLHARLSNLADSYQSADPFPHVVLDEVFDQDLLHQVAAEFPAPAEMSGKVRRPREFKFAESRWQALGPTTRSVIAEMNSGPFLKALSALTGIQDLVADAQLVGGGQHQIGRGGRLGIHADFNKHYGNGLDRRLNVLLYLNPDWEPAWGGQLELWDTSMSRKVQDIDPVLGRMVVFSTTSTSYHGHPDPLGCPADRFRRSLALYYYTNGRDDTVDDQAHSTLFQVRHGSRKDRWDRLLSSAARWVPPALEDAATKGLARARRVGQSGFVA